MSDEEKTIIRPDTSEYISARSASGAKSQHNGTPVALALEGATLDETYELASDILDTPVKELQEKYGHLNVGQQRMNLGNRIRGAIAKLNKEKEGSGDSALAKLAKPLRKTVEARTKAAAKAKAEKEKAAAKAKAKAA